MKYIIFSAKSDRNRSSKPPTVEQYVHICTIIKSLVHNDVLRVLSWR